MNNCQFDTKKYFLLENTNFYLFKKEFNNYLMTFRIVF
jgi:hypothetical protein